MLIVKCYWCALSKGRCVKYINSAKKKWIDINIFKGNEKKLVCRALRWCLLIPFYPTAALEKVDSWNDNPLKKVNAHTWTILTTAPLNHACGFEKEANIVDSVCGLTQSRVDRQVIGGRGGERETGMEQSWKWMQMEARATMGGPGAWRRVYLKKMCSKSSESLNVTRYKWISLIVRFQYFQTH